MILTHCAACAAPLAHNAPRCVRCKLRYCNATCQHDHWRRGHKDGDATPDEVLDAYKMLEEALRRSRRIFGAAHPQTINMEHNLGVLQNWMGFTQFASRVYEAHKKK